MTSRFIVMVAIAVLLLTTASPAVSYAEPAVNSTPRLVLFEGFYNPS